MPAPGVQSLTKDGYLGMDSFDVMTATVGAIAWCACLVGDRVSPMPAVQAAAIALCNGVAAVIFMVMGPAHMMMMAATIAAWFAWLAWTRRNRRRRKPSRVGSRLRDLGHRLVETPA